jgi:serine/arginine repetitive matrix protein 2
VRGIPRRHDEGDSTDLEDSSDEERKKKAKDPTPAPISTAVAKSPVPAAPLSPNTMKKKGLWSRFRSKKEKDEPPKSRLGAGTMGDREKITERTAPAVNSAKKEDDDDEDAPAGNFDNMGFGSAAERDAMIAQTMAKLEAAKGGSTANSGSTTNLGTTGQRGSTTNLGGTANVSSPVGSVSGPATGSPAASNSPGAGAIPGSPVNGRLQRRATPQRFASDSWPLPPKIGALDEVDRPSTADPTTNGRPGIGNRVPTSETLKTDGGTPITGRSGKKKRFPLLRKAFGLKD